MAGKGKGRGRPRITELELTTENKQAILDYIKQGMTVQEVAKELKTTVKQVRSVYSRYQKEAELAVELDRVDKQVSRIIEMTINPREDRITKMHEMLNNTVDALYERYEEDESGLDSGDFAMILKLLERDEQTVMAAGRLQTVKKKNNDSRYMYNKEKMIKVDEMNRQYKDTSESDILTVEKVIDDIES